MCRHGLISVFIRTALRGITSQCAKCHICINPLTTKAHRTVCKRRPKGWRQQKFQHRWDRGSLGHISDWRKVALVSCWRGEALLFWEWDHWLIFYALVDSSTLMTYAKQWLDLVSYPPKKRWDWEGAYYEKMRRIKEGSEMNLFF